MKHLYFLFGVYSIFCLPAWAADWGYEEAETAPPLTEMRAPKPKQSVSPSGFVRSAPPAKPTVKPKPETKTTLPPKPVAPSAAATVPAKEKAAATTESYVDKNKQAAVCWLQLCQGACKTQLSFSQQKGIEAYMLGKAKQGGAKTEEVLSVLKFWPQFIFKLRDKAELEFQYADLFRALLRIRQGQNCEKITVDGSDYTSDSELITDLLGVERIAVAGEPPMTEAAVNAYADMACFIYEQQHDGKTIDANDNRALFARVITEKFKAAPTAADRQAMASFDLAWAKFKIIWFNSSEKTRHLLLEKLIKSGAGSTMTVAKDPVMELILSNWPWPH
ncbi:MAG: hypothetical protein K2W82_01005 [Candidatus Obscuribacterales bacterium]|nr:hypothetical protein [Candidatus Obscuribacterales bacterium]